MVFIDIDIARENVRSQCTGCGLGLSKMAEAGNGYAEVLGKANA